MNTTGDTTMQDDSDEQQEVIEVQILPQVRLYFEKQSESEFFKKDHTKKILKSMNQLHEIKKKLREINFKAFDFTSFLELGDYSG